jgi:hypothetical protein
MHSLIYFFVLAVKFAIRNSQFVIPYFDFSHNCGSTNIASLLTRN